MALMQAPKRGKKATGSSSSSKGGGSNSTVSRLGSSLLIKESEKVAVRNCRQCFSTKVLKPAAEHSHTNAKSVSALGPPSMSSRTLCLLSVVNLRSNFGRSEITLSHSGIWFSGIRLVSALVSILAHLWTVLVQSSPFRANCNHS